MRRHTRPPHPSSLLGKLRTDLLPTHPLPGRRRLAYLEKRRRGVGMSLLRRLFLGCFSSAPRSPGPGPSARPSSHLRSVPCAMDPLRQSAASLRSSQLVPVPLEQGPPIRPRNRAQARFRAAGQGGPARARPPNPGLEPDGRRGRAFGSPGDAGHASVPNYASPVAGAGASPVAGAGASPARGPSASGRARRCLAPALPRVAGLAAASNASPARGSPLKGELAGGQVGRWDGGQEGQESGGQGGW